MKFVVVQVLATIVLGVWPTAKDFILKYKRLALLLFVLAIISLVLTAFVGCSFLPVKGPEEMAKHTYRKSLKFEVDGKTYEGIAVLPQKPCYDFTIIPEDKMKEYLFQTWHRDEQNKKPKTGWFSNKVKYKYCPQVDKEDLGYSPLEIAATNEDQENDAYALIMLEDKRPEVSLEARLRCNGKFTMVNGVSICQSAAGLSQDIFFNQKVLIVDIDDPGKNKNYKCEMPTSKDGFFWTINLSEGECPYGFVARERHKNGERLKHLFVTVGYTALQTGE